MKTAEKIEIAYRVAKYAGREHADLLSIEDDGQTVTIRKDDPTGEYTSEWTIWVDRSALRQVARVYVPRTGYESAISANDVDMVVVLDNDPEKEIERTRSMREHDRKMKQYRYLAA